jgi:dTDP-4-dehydrorhamnose 3,5-epimerase
MTMPRPTNKPRYSAVHSKAELLPHATELQQLRAKRSTGLDHAQLDRPGVRIKETGIPGCYELGFSAFSDARGLFVKTTHATEFSARGLSADFLESYYTVSGPRVLRGMHLLLPPADHAKLVYCVAGQVMDVALDLRDGSPAFGRFAMTELSAEQSGGLYLPSGVAHGFYVRQAPAIMLYHVTSEHVRHLDAGVRWDSINAPWPDSSPVLSERDASLPMFCDFTTPFVFGAGAIVRSGRGAANSRAASLERTGRDAPRRKNPQQEPQPEDAASSCAVSRGTSAP